MTPVDRAAWPGPPAPVRGGVAVACISWAPAPASDEDRSFGTLGLALEIQGARYLTSSFHVTPAGNGEQAVCPWRADGEWSKLAGLEVVRYVDSFGAADEADLSFLRATVPIANAPPGDDTYVVPEVALPQEGEVLWFRGARDERWVECEYRGPLDAESHAALYGSLADFDPEVNPFGEVTLLVEDGAYDPEQFPGDSGAAVWVGRGVAYACVGHIVAGSQNPAVPRAVIVLYRPAFELLGLSGKYACIQADGTIQ